MPKKEIHFKADEETFKKMVKFLDQKRGKEEEQSELNVSIDIPGLGDLKNFTKSVGGFSKTLKDFALSLSTFKLDAPDKEVMVDVKIPENEKESDPDYTEQLKELNDEVQRISEKIREAKELEQVEDIEIKASDLGFEQIDNTDELKDISTKLENIEQESYVDHFKNITEQLKRVGSNIVGLVTDSVDDDTKKSLNNIAKQYKRITELIVGPKEEAVDPNQAFQEQKDEKTRGLLGQIEENTRKDGEVQKDKEKEVSGLFSTLSGTLLGNLLPNLFKSLKTKLLGLGTVLFGPFKTLANIIKTSKLGQLLGSFGSGLKNLGKIFGAVLAVGQGLFEAFKGFDIGKTWEQNVTAMLGGLSAGILDGLSAIPRALANMILGVFGLETEFLSAEWIKDKLKSISDSILKGFTEPILDIFFNDKLSIGQKFWETFEHIIELIRGAILDTVQFFSTGNIIDSALDFFGVKEKDSDKEDLKTLEKEEIQSRKDRRLKEQTYSDMKQEAENNKKNQDTSKPQQNITNIQQTTNNNVSGFDRTPSPRLSEGAQA